MLAFQNANEGVLLTRLETFCGTASLWYVEAILADLEVSAESQMHITI